MLHLLLAHPLLSQADLAAYLFVQPHTVAVLLSSLRRWGLVEHLASLQYGTRFWLSDRGLRLMAAMLSVSVAHLATSHVGSSGRSHLLQREVSPLRRLLRHTSGISGFFATLSQATRHHIAVSLHWWETGARAARRYRFGGRWHNLRPDAFFVCRLQAEEQQTVAAWLEWDEGTMHTHQLRAKLSSYATFMQAKQWSLEMEHAPLLLFVVPNYEQEQRVIRVVQMYLEHISLQVYVTTTSLLKEQEPLASIWRLAVPFQGANEQRVCWQRPRRT